MNNQITIRLLDAGYEVKSQGDAPHFCVTVADSRDIEHVIEHYFGTGTTLVMHEMNVVSRCELCKLKWQRS